MLYTQEVGLLFCCVAVVGGLIFQGFASAQDRSCLCPSPIKVAKPNLKVKFVPVRCIAPEVAREMIEEYDPACRGGFASGDEPANLALVVLAPIPVHATAGNTGQSPDTRIRKVITRQDTQSHGVMDMPTVITGMQRIDHRFPTHAYVR